MIELYEFNQDLKIRLDIKVLNFDAWLPHPYPYSFLDLGFGSITLDFVVFGFCSINIAAQIKNKS